MARPFLNKTGVELESIFNKAKNEPDILNVLYEELGHRTKSKMSKLRRRVKQQLECINPPSPPPSREQPIQHTPKETPSMSGAGPIRSDNLTEPPSAEGRCKKQSNSYSDPFDEMNQKSSGVSRIRPSGNLTGVPSKFHFDLKSNVQLNLDESASLLTRYEAGLKALIVEMRKKGAGAKQVALENGQKIKVDGHDFGYQFPFDGEVDLFEGAKVEAFIGSSRTEGQIAAIFGKKIILGLQDDFGPHISHCILKVDNTAMLEALRSRLEKIGNKEESGFNEVLAGAVIENDGQENLPGSLVGSSLEGLNKKQREAACKITTNEIFYLWGPPGTGKTQTLSVVNLALFEAGKKILICSNTNQAVDQVLLKLCNKFGKSHPALVEGKIVRVGKINHPELEAEWSDYVTLDGIVERKSTELNKRKKRLENELEHINQQAATTLEIYRSFERLDQLESQQRDFLQQLETFSQKAKGFEGKRMSAANKLANLRAELEKVRKKGILGFFRRSVEAVENDINRIIADIKSLEEATAASKQKMNDLGPQYEALKRQIDQNRASLSKHDRKTIEKQIEELNEKKQPVIQEISSINKELDDIAKSVLANARIVGATVTKSYLSPKLFSGFDVVIIDEASMVMMPALFYAAGLAKEKVVISGDFRQLSPIVQTDQQEIFEAVGGDVFQSSGLVEAFRESRSLKRAVMLDEQYRMDGNICKIISSRMYNNKLQTAPSISLSGNLLPEPFHRPLIIVDTSTIFPFSNKDLFKSRYNLMHALAVRNLCLHFQDKRYLKSGSVGVCTPYSAQAKLSKKVLCGSGLDKVDAGTVHRYQGDEKSVMILDVPDSLGERYAGIFLQADNPEDAGAKLFNVAVSRAKEHLIVFANLAFLDEKLPNHAILRDILAEMQDQGAVVDVRDVLSLWPIMEDLKRYGYAFDLSPDAEKTGLFDQKDFETVCQADLAGAQKSIVIFSGFITEQRVASYESLFRTKIAEGVKIRCVTRPPHRNGNIPEENGRAALDGLEKMGCVIDTRGNIHEKAVIIDGQTVWFGSLNPLSHTAKTAEVMARIEGSDVALQFASFLAIGKHKKSDNASELFTAKENPECPECKARVTYMTGKYGPYWDCDDCNWRESVGNGVAKPRGGGSNGTKKGPACPKCGAITVKRKGRFGEFYGCSAYPNCKYTSKVLKRS